MDITIAAIVIGGLVVFWAIYAASMRKRRGIPEMSEPMESRPAPSERKPTEPDSRKSA